MPFAVDEMPLEGCSSENGATTNPCSSNFSLT